MNQNATETTSMTTAPNAEAAQKAKLKGNQKRAGGSLIKRFVGNRNTVTILGILACIATLIIGYNYRVSVAISPVTVPYAKQNIPSRTLITSDMIGNIKVTSTYTNTATNLIKNASSVVNKYASYKTNIPRGSLFYKDQIIEADEMPDAAFANVADGYTIFPLTVDSEKTYFNSIRAGDYIDLYVSAQEKTEDDTASRKVIIAKLVESIKVLAVKDKKGKNILKNTMENGKPAQLLFAVEEEMFLLLKKAENVDLDVTIMPVLRNDNYTAKQGETLVSSEDLRAFILERCVSI